MYKKMIFMVVIISFIASPAFASNGIIADLATGVAGVFGALLGVGHNSQMNVQQKQLKQQAETQKQLEKIREAARTFTKGYASLIAQLVSKAGYENACKVLDKHKGTSKGENGWETEIYREKAGDKIIFREINTMNGQINTISIDKQECVVKMEMENPLINLSESATEHFVLPEKTNEPVRQDTKKEFNMFSTAGFDVADGVKSNEGYLIVSKVRKGSVVSTFGMLEGTELYQIDNMNTKQCTADEVRSYIAVQAEKNATIAVYFMDENGKSKRVDVKL